MPDHVRIALLTAASRAAAAGHPLEERDGLAILLEALRLSARRGVSVAGGALCIDEEGKLSFRAHPSEVPRRDPVAQVEAACALAGALFRGNPPLPFEPASFPTIEQMIVAAELRVLRAGEARLATQSEARRAAAALFARAAEEAEPVSDATDAIADKLLPANGAARPSAAAEDEPLLSQIPGLSERDLHRDGAAASPLVRVEVPAPAPADHGLGGADSRAQPSSEAGSPQSALPASSADSPFRPAAARGQWMLPTALLLATASAFPVGRRTAWPSRPPPPLPVPEARQDEAKTAVLAASSPAPSASVVQTSLLPEASSLEAPPAAAAGISARASSRSAARKLELGERAVQAGRYFQAIVAFRDALEGPAPMPRAARRLGDVYRLQDEPSKAASAYRKYLELAPDAPDAREVENTLTELEEP